MEPSLASDYHTRPYGDAENHSDMVGAGVE